MDKTANRLIIASEIVLFNFIGLFGNIHVIVLIFRKSRLQSKSCLLQCVLAISQIICLISELPNAITLVGGIQLRRYTCWKILAPYVFFVCVQTFLMLILIIDIYIIVFFPGLYHTTPNIKYLGIMLICPCIYGMSLVIAGFLTTDDELLNFCNPSSAFHPTTSKIYAYSLLAIDTVIVTFFVVLIVIFAFQKQKPESRKIMKRLKISVVVFIFSWYMCILGIGIVVDLGFGPTVVEIIQANLVVFALLSYSQTFYVMMWKSFEYRDAFLELWSCFPSLKKVRTSQKIISSVQNVTVI